MSLVYLLRSLVLRESDRFGTMRTMINERNSKKEGKLKETGSQPF